MGAGRSPIHKTGSSRLADRVIWMFQLYIVGIFRVRPTTIYLADPDLECLIDLYPECSYLYLGCSDLE